MDVSQMQRNYVDYARTLFMEGYLDDLFCVMQNLNDRTNPEFTAQVVSGFFDNAHKHLNDITLALSQATVDFKSVYEQYVHPLKGGSSSIGAKRVATTCIDFRKFCAEQNLGLCLGCLQQVKEEYNLVKNKLETLFNMERQIVAGGGSVPMLKMG